MAPKTTKGRPRRTHSLGGCATCRRRHVKCDQVQPLCLTCKAVGVTCEGYSSNFQWMTTSPTEKPKAPKAEANTTRRFLYSEKSRASMSTELTTNLPSNSVDASLTQIDSWSKNNQSGDQDNLAVGPFGVLSFNNASSTMVEPGNVPPTQPIGEPGSSEEILPTPSTLDPLMSLDDTLQWADLFALDFGNEFLMQQDPFAPIVQDLAPSFDFNLGVGTGQTAQWTSSASIAGAILHNSAIAGTDDLHIPISPFTDSSAPSADLHGDTHVLLRHFQDNVVDAMAGVPWTSKSPWKNQFLLNAVQTLADLTFLGGKVVKHANAANMYSLLSCAARHLCTKSSEVSQVEPNRWLRFADWSLEKAKTHLQLSMRNEFEGDGRAKYKDQLMASIATMAACQLAGQQTEVRHYTLNAERVLRLRGLAKREISRKARFLHHIYTWARIVGESTYVIHDYKSYASAVQSLSVQHQKRPVIRSAETDKAMDASSSATNHNTRLDDFLRIETQHDSDLEIDEPKEAVVGLYDIHLEDSRNHSASLYLEIYGIPETWLSLVSQTTRLANVMSTLKESNKETNIAFQNALQKRAGRLENMICSFAFKSASTDFTSVTSQNEKSEAPKILPNHYMVQALNSALVIFFYRRIRDVNPWILQSHVENVIKALDEFDTALVEQNVKGPGTAWPAFMAGCEAIAPRHREATLKWIQTAGSQSGLCNYKTAEETMLEVWRRRDEGNKHPSPRAEKSNGSNATSSRVSQTNWTWLDISKEKNLWLMLG